MVASRRGLTISYTLHPTVIAAEEGALVFFGQQASHRKEPLEVAHLKQLADRTDVCSCLLLLFFFHKFKVMSCVQ